LERSNFVKAQITVLPGDGIGPEVIQEALKVLQQIATHFGHEFIFDRHLLGGCAIDATGNPLPEETLLSAQSADAVLLGAVGGPQWETLPGHLRPEAGLLGLRKGLNAFANLRPVCVWPQMTSASPLREEIVVGTDMVIVRELTGGVYFGEPRGRHIRDGGTEAVDTMVYHETEIERIVRIGFETAMSRRKHLTSVDKANVLETSRLWREVVNRIAPEYPEVTVEHMLVDTAAMQLAAHPTRFDVLVTENLFGDILSDEAAMISGSMGMLPSASLNEHGSGIYEPIHGSAPDIAGTGKANPLATILSVAMMLRFSLKLPEEAEALEMAVQQVIEAGLRTADLAKAGDSVLGTAEMGDAVCAAMQRRMQHV
jgi:3-isopropylmalate dehydrogenase